MKGNFIFYSVLQSNIFDGKGKTYSVFLSAHFALFFAQHLIFVPLGGAGVSVVSKNGVFYKSSYLRFEGFPTPGIEPGPPG